MNHLKTEIDVTRRIVPFLLAIAVVAAMTMPVWAGNDPNGSISTTLKLTTATEVGGGHLAAGEYRLTVEGGQAKFQQGKKVVLRVPCVLKDLTFMPQATVFVLDRGSISEIQVSGNTKAIEFSSGLSATN